MMKFTVIGEAKLILIEHLDYKRGHAINKRCYKPRCRQSLRFNISWDKKEIRSRIRR